MCFVKTHHYTLCPPGHRRVILRKKCHLRPRIFGISLWNSICPCLDISNEDVGSLCPNCARKKREDEEKLRKRERRDQAILEWQRIRQASAAAEDAENKAIGLGSTIGSQQQAPQNAGRYGGHQVLPSVSELPADLASRHPIQSQLVSPTGQALRGAENHTGFGPIHPAEHPKAEIHNRSRRGREQAQGSEPTRGELPVPSETDIRSRRNAVFFPTAVDSALQPGFFVQRPVQAPRTALGSREFSVAGASIPRDSLFLPASATFLDQPSQGYFPEWRVMYDATENTLTTLIEEPEAMWGRLWRGTDGVRSRLATAELDASENNTKTEDTKSATSNDRNFLPFIPAEKKYPQPQQHPSVAVEAVAGSTSQMQLRRASSVMEVAGEPLRICKEGNGRSLGRSSSSPYPKRNSGECGGQGST